MCSNNGVFVNVTNRTNAPDNNSGQLWLLGQWASHFFATHFGKSKELSFFTDITAAICLIVLFLLKLPFLIASVDSTESLSFFSSEAMYQCFVHASQNKNQIRKMIVQSFADKDKRILTKKVIPACVTNLAQLASSHKRQAAIFDLDGTLLVGKTPRTELVDFLNSLPFECVIVTARTTSYRDSTIKQLEKHGVYFHDLITMPKSVDKSKEGAVAEFKAACRERISEDRDIVLSVGDQWTDIHGIDASTINNNNYDRRRFYVGPNFIKLPDYLCRFEQGYNKSPASRSSLSDSGEWLP
jgi:predicted secreted acid phosphatase